MVTVRHLGFLKFEILTGLIQPISVIVPNFVASGQTVAELSRSAFNVTVVRHLVFLKIRNLNGR